MNIFSGEEAQPRPPLITMQLLKQKYDYRKWVTQIWNSLEDPDGTGAKTYHTSRVNVWVIMDADADLNTLDDQYEFPVDGYRVIDPESGS